MPFPEESGDLKPPHHMYSVTKPSEMVINEMTLIVRGQGVFWMGKRRSHSPGYDEFFSNYPNKLAIYPYDNRMAKT
jgi:hypothetical protein